MPNKLLLSAAVGTPVAVTPLPELSAFARWIEKEHGPGAAWIAPGTDARSIAITLKLAFSQPRTIAVHSIADRPFSALEAAKRWQEVFYALLNRKMIPKYPRLPHINRRDILDVLNESPAPSNSALARALVILGVYRLMRSSAKKYN